MNAAHGPFPAVVAAAAGRAPGIGRMQAQRLARAELSKQEYHRHIPLAQRIIAVILGFAGRVFHAASGVVPGGWWGLIALAALAVIVTAGVLNWIGLARSRRAPRPLTADGAVRTARQHRQEAQRHAGTGDYAAAVIECVRAIATELEERGVLPPRAGRTADELADEAGQALPAQARALRDATRLFDEVCYGQRPGSRQGYERLAELDRLIMASAPRVTRPSSVSAAPTMAGGRAP